MTEAMKADDRRVWDCPVFRWSGDLARCRACDGPLTGRRTRWCSDRCSNWFAKNHFWSWARVERLRIDGYRCTRCGAGPGYPPPVPWHVTPWVRKEKLLGQHVVLEVNHVWPLAHQSLRHSDSGCHHHLSLLVTLCKDCHRRITNQQFGFRQEPEGPPPLRLDLEAAL